MLTADDCLRDGQAGGKGRNLARAAQVVEVPPFIVVPADWFRIALGAKAEQIEHEWRSLLDHGRAELTATAARVHAVLSGIGPDAAMRRSLEAGLRRALPGAGALAVRSSAATEDSLAGSEAGLYESLLGVYPAEAPDAVAACWASYFGPRVLAYRLAHRQPWQPPRMAVVIQQMITSVAAGVGFSRGRNTVLVESVDGSARALVSGRTVPQRTTVTASARIHPGQPWQGPLVDAVGRLYEHFDAEVDVEWVWDGTDLHIVQVRPVFVAPAPPPTAAPISAEPVVRTKGVYTEEDTDGFDTLDAIERIYGHYRRKRKTLQDIAARHHCAAGVALAVQFNGHGLRSPAWTRLLARFCGQVVVDASDEIRQLIVDIADLTSTLEELQEIHDDPATVHTAVVREFLTGTAGALSRLRGGALHVEHSTAGLLAINRGLTSTTHLSVTADGAVAGTVPQDWDRSTLPRIRAVAEEFARTHPSAAIEWTIQDGRPHAIDYSGARGDIEPWLPGQRAGVLSRGTCEGPAVMVGNEFADDLETSSVAPIVSLTAPIPADAGRYISELHARVLACPAPPVVVVDHPYAILAVLIGAVAGFVFRTEASLLCHLMILLREHGVPAVAAPGVVIDDGATVHLLSDGTVQVEGHR